MFDQGAPFGYFQYMNDTSIPACVGIILDGNRRWAKERGLPTLQGHKKGMENIEPVVLAARDFGIQHVAIYAFSTENWNRTQEEVGYLMQLFEEAIRTHLMRLTQEHIRVRFIGQRERFSTNLRAAMDDIEHAEVPDARMTLWVCLSYGGRAEILDAANKVEGEITEESLRSSMWSAEMPDADIIIRPGGEKRFSNFLLWQSAYSELFFVNEYWPAFTPEMLNVIVKEYAERERRHGK